MNKAAWIIVGSILVVVIIVIIVLGISQHEPQTIRIGAILPLTGDAAPYGKAARQAIEMALEEVNAESRNDGSLFIVIYEDDHLDSKTAASAANKLCTVDKVKVIIGPMASAAIEAVLPIAERSHVVVISPAATAHNLSGRKGFFRTIVSDVYDGTAMAEFSFNKLKFKKIPVLYIEAAGPAGVAQSFIKRFKELGGDVPLVEAAPPNTTDFRTQLSKIKGANPHGFYFAAYAVESATILKQAKELGINKQMLSHQLVEDPEVRKRAGDAANGIIYTTPKLDPSKGGPAVKSFYAKFKKKYNEEPRNFASNSYDALKLVIKAIKENDNTFEGISKGLFSIKNYPGASGIMSIDSKGDVLQPMRIMTIRGGKTVDYK